MNHTYTPGMKLYAGPWTGIGTIHVVERVTPGGRAVIERGRQITPDGYEYGAKGARAYSRPRYRPATEADERMVADDIAVCGLFRRMLDYGFRRPPLTAEECATIGAILDAADARKGAK